MLGLTFDLIRRLNQYHANQAEHVWKAMGNIISVEGSTILVLGLGDIGGDYARKVHALGAHVIGVRRTNRNKPDYLDEQHTMDDLDTLLGRADIVAMVLPGGSATNHIMDERRLRLMKKGAYLINVGRGNAIDPDGLYKVLKDGHLGGCGLDVTEPEPLPADSPLWELENLVITPHVAGNFFLRRHLSGSSGSREKISRPGRTERRTGMWWILRRDIESNSQIKSKDSCSFVCLYGG